MSVQTAVKVDRIEYKGWRNCYRVSNGDVELVVTGDVGPRVIRYGFPGGQNVFKEVREQLGESGEESFMLRGGHRVWKAPEDPVASWAPDNVPVEVRVMPTGLIAREPVEPLTRLQKEIEVRMAESGSGVTVYHRITNRSVFPLEFAAWAMSVMAPGGRGIAGFPPRGRHPEVLPPTNPLVMWAYTNLGDPRWRFTLKYMMLRQDPTNSEPQKIGLFNPDTWAVYLLNGEAFVKRATADPAKTYPDFGCSFETFTNSEFLELETLGPVTKVEPEQTLEHVEQWGLFRDVSLPGIADEQLTRVLAPLLEATGRAV